jgi:D-aminopeptidase
MRARDAGYFPWSGATGPTNGIVDVPGVAVGHCTLISGDGALDVGRGPVRTGVTVVIPQDAMMATNPLFAGIHRLTGNGELTGSHWIEESGLLTSPIALTNTHSVGVVRDALVAAEAAQRAKDRQGGQDWWSLPVVAETCDGVLNDIHGSHVRPEHVAEALRTATRSGVAEGNVGGGTGMICHGFKGGIGTSSRALAPASGGYTVGVLVQANHGTRSRLVVDGVPIGRLIDEPTVPLAGFGTRDGAGSIITVIATDAPLLPHQCRAVAARAALGIGRAGGVGESWSGDISIAFATGNRGVGLDEQRGPGPRVATLVDAEVLSAVYAATVDATEEAIINALFAAETMVGRDGITAHALPIEAVVDLMETGRRTP